MNVKEIVLAAVFGSGGLFGLTVFLFKRWLEKKLEQAETSAQKHKEEQQERYIVNDEYQHAVGRFLFWTAEGIRNFEEVSGTSYWNGNLQKAYENVEEAEAKRKELDRRQLASVNEE